MRLTVVQVGQCGWRSYVHYRGKGAGSEAGHSTSPRPGAASPEGGGSHNEPSNVYVAHVEDLEAWSEAIVESVRQRPEDE
jgi:hypothetical protein